MEERLIKVTKFGGTSMAEVSQFEKVKEILSADESRMVAVPSAPGKRNSEDIKVTDMLIGCFEKAASGTDFACDLGMVSKRFSEIKAGLGVDTDIDCEIERIKSEIKNGASGDYVKSRGEYLSGKLLADYLGWKFVDPADVIKFNERGELNTGKTYALIKNACEGEKCVLPGFFGSGPDGRIITFSRGGSDITGSIAAAALDADVYENWTDVSGFYMTDPRVVADVRHIDQISYEELRELSYMGAGVLHENAIFPVRQKRIPINIKNTNRPEDPGTMIVAKENLEMHGLPITGIAGKQGFSIINIYKESMNSELGFARRILSVLEDHKISFEHIPTGIDTISVVVADEFLKGKEESVIGGIKQAVRPDEIEIIPDMALIATCGHGMVHHEGTAARLFSALAENGVNIRMIDQGSSELNIIVGIENADYEKAIKAIYNGFIN
jgi:aspartate kinase